MDPRDISSRGLKLYVVATTAGIPRPSRIEVEGWADEGDFLSIEKLRTMDTKPTADGKQQYWVVTEDIPITINLSPTSPNWFEFSQVLQEQAGLGNTYLISKWNITCMYKDIKVVCVDGVQTEGTLLPNIGYERLSNLSYTISYRPQNIKFIKI